jgi:hypothetical protein
MKIANLIIDHLCNEETKAEVIKELNKSIDIPIINEKTEAKILDALYGVFENTIKAVLLK